MPRNQSEKGKKMPPPMGRADDKNEGFSFVVNTVEVGGGFFSLVIRCTPNQVAAAIQYGKAQRERLNGQGAKLIGGFVFVHAGQQMAEIPD